MNVEIGIQAAQYAFSGNIGFKFSVWCFWSVLLILCRVNILGQCVSGSCSGTGCGLRVLLTKIVKLLQLKKFFFKIKIYNFVLSLTASMLLRSPQKKTSSIQSMKFFTFSIFWTIFALLDRIRIQPTKINAHPCWSGAQHWFLIFIQYLTSSSWPPRILSEVFFKFSSWIFSSMYKYFFRYSLLLSKSLLF